MSNGVATILRKVEPETGRLGPGHGLIYESVGFHHVQLNPGQSVNLIPRGAVFRMQFWDCAMVSEYLRDSENEFVNPETTRPTDDRFFGVLAPVPVSDVGDGPLLTPALRPGQVLSFGSFWYGEELTVKVVLRRGRGPLLERTSDPVWP